MSEIVQVNFRMPKDLKDKLEQAAQQSGRSITSELVTRLEQSFSDFDDASFQLRLREAIEHQKKMDATLAEIMQEIQALKKPTA
ncbi:Arc family DNA-binding protein [Moraxellaceae bacterium 17A]|nr:Arc family DNA-binding protein [Moraxellaceae bacterium 17A]